MKKEIILLIFIAIANYSFAQININELIINIKNNEAVYSKKNSNRPFSGIAYSYYYSGEIFGRYNFKNGKKEGKSTEYHINGNIRKIITYKAGLKDGDYSEYDENGVLLLKEKYKKGNKVGYWQSMLKDLLTDSVFNNSFTEKIIFDTVDVDIKLVERLKDGRIVMDVRFFNPTNSFLVIDTTNWILVKSDTLNYLYNLCDTVNWGICKDAWGTLPVNVLAKGDSTSIEGFELDNKLPLKIMFFYGMHNDSFDYRDQLNTFHSHKFYFWSAFMHSPEFTRYYKRKYIKW
jgi:hypothetical protein